MVVGTGKLGYNVVATTGKVTTDIAVGTVLGTGKVVVGAGKTIGKRMSKLMNLNDSFNRGLDAMTSADLGYEDADAVLQYTLYHNRINHHPHRMSGAEAMDPEDGLGAVRPMGLLAKAHPLLNACRVVARPMAPLPLNCKQIDRRDRQ